ncbi:MAG: hypothetical protein ACLS89_08305 [Collinsella sp.]
MAEVWRFLRMRMILPIWTRLARASAWARAVVSDHLEHGCQAVDWQPFDDLRAYMQQAWPHAFAAARSSLSTIRYS